MTNGPGMPPARRRLIPGTAVSPPPTVHQDATAKNESARSLSRTGRTPPRSPRGNQTGGGPDPGVRRRPSTNYAATRLVNFRLPTDLHDRYKQLVREVEERFPRLRRPSLTDLIIALLEEGPADAAEVAELIRRKRAGEHGGSA